MDVVSSTICENLRLIAFMSSASSEKWKHFERLVTAIHQAADSGADVRWNETISDRQFDVTIRFQKGLYNYLTVIECKAYGRAVPVEKVEAFVTKAKDVNAHHAVMASTSGFQEAAKAVAARHNMTLIHVSDSEEIDLSRFQARWTGTTPAFHIQRVALLYVDGEKKTLPENANALKYYVNHILIQYGSEVDSLDGLIQNYSPGFDSYDSDGYKDHLVACPSGTRVIGPNDGEVPLRPLASIHFRMGVIQARTLTSPSMFDTFLLVPKVKIQNLATGQENTFDPHGLALGVNTVFAPGTFYEQYYLGSYYYCVSVDGDTATFYLVESFQLGQLVQGRYATRIENAGFYVPISDEAIIRRLRSRLDRLKKALGE